MTITAYWCLSNNVGDALGAYFVQKLTGELPVWGKPGDAQYILNGSVLNHAARLTICFGAGLASLKDEVNQLADIRAVRGPLSRMIAQASGAKAPAIYGDLGMLMPDLYDPSRSAEQSPGRYRLGIVPHYVDQLRAWEWHRNAKDVEGVRLINVFDSVESVIDQIASCDRIISSSLHGLVFAHAYGIPALWVKIGDGIGGDGTKYRDHLLSVGVEPYEPLDLRNGWFPTADLARRVDSTPQPTEAFDTSDLWDACPIGDKP